MATIEHISGADREAVIERAREVFAQMAPGVLAAQDMVLRGAIDCLSTLLARGCNEQDARAMLDDCLLTLGLVHGTAAKRNIRLAALDLVKPGAVH